MDYLLQGQVQGLQSGGPVFLEFENQNLKSLFLKSKMFFPIKSNIIENPEISVLYNVKEIRNIFHSKLKDTLNSKSRIVH